MTTEARRLYDADEDGAALALAGRAVEAARACARPDLDFSARLVLCNAAMAMRNGELAATEVSRLLTLAKASDGATRAVSGLALERARVLGLLGRADEALHELDKGIESAERTGFVHGLGSPRYISL